MIEWLRELSYRIERNRRTISRVLLISLLSALQIGGGFTLLQTDVTRGTPAVIHGFGIDMPTFSVVMLAFGVLTIALLIFMRDTINAAMMCVLTTPFIAYMAFTGYGVTHGLQSGQGFFFYLVFYLIAMISIWGSD